MPKYNQLIQTLEKPKYNICIYGLLDPDTDELKYIGQTIQGFKRITEHYHKSNKKSRTTNYFSHSNIWINYLKNNNTIFKVIYLEYFDNNDNLDESEQFWIEYFKSLGCKLINHEIGGKRNKGLDLEQRKLISLRTKEAMNNPILRKKLSDRLKGKPSTFKGKKLSEEAKKKLSLSQEKKVYYLKDENNNIYRGCLEAAKALNCSVSAVRHFIHGRTKSIYGKKLIILK